MSKGRTVNLTALADIFGVSQPTVRAWLRRGCPFEQHGAQNKAWKFRTSEVARWREEQAAAAAVGDMSAVDIDEARRRKLAAEAANEELNLAQRRGELIEIEAVADTVGEEYTRIRARLLALPTKLAPQMETAMTLQERREIIEDAIAECLSELSADSDYVAEEPDPEEDETKAAA